MFKWNYNKKVVGDINAMIPEMKKFDGEAVEEQAEAEVVVDNSDKQLVEQPQNGQKLAFKDYKLENIEAVVDNSKSFSEQVEEYVDVSSTMAAAKDEETQNILTQQKKEQLIGKATVKVKEVQKEAIEAETDIQKAKREKYQLLFDTFGVSDHIPDWLLKVLMVIFAPFYILYVVVIGIPSGFVRYAIDCFDGILVRYDKADNSHKPKVKVAVWVLLALIVVGVICLITLKCLHII